MTTILGQFGSLGKASCNTALPRSAVEHAGVSTTLDPSGIDGVPL